MQSTREASRKDSAAEQAVAQWEKDCSSRGQTFVIWNMEKHRKIKTKKSWRLSSWSYNGAGYVAIMGTADRSKGAKCWNQPVTPRRTAHVTGNTECYATPKSAVPGKLVALVTSLPSTFQGFGGWWPFRGKYQRQWVWALSQHNSVCYSASARHCAHYVVTDCVHAVTFAGGFGPNTREPSQNHEPTWLRRPLGKGKSCLLFQNFPKPNHFLKATKIHQFFQESTPLMASKEISDHQMTPSMGFLSTLNLRSHSHTSATHLSWNPCVVWVHNALGNGTRSNTGRFHWWEYAPCRTHEILPYMQGRQVNVKS